MKMDEQYFKELEEMEFGDMSEDLFDEENENNFQKSQERMPLDTLSTYQLITSMAVVLNRAFSQPKLRSGQGPF